MKKYFVVYRGRAYEGTSPDQVVTKVLNNTTAKTLNLTVLCDVSGLAMVLPGDNKVTSIMEGTCKPAIKAKLVYNPDRGGYETVKQEKLEGFR